MPIGKVNNPEGKNQWTNGTAVRKAKSAAESVGKRFASTMNSVKAKVAGAASNSVAAAKSRVAVANSTLSAKKTARSVGNKAKDALNSAKTEGAIMARSAKTEGKYALARGKAEGKYAVKRASAALQHGKAEVSNTIKTRQETKAAKTGLDRTVAKIKGEGRNLVGDTQRKARDTAAKAERAASVTEAKAVRTVGRTGNKVRAIVSRDLDKVDSMGRRVKAAGKDARDAIAANYAKGRAAAETKRNAQKVKRAP